MTKRRPPRSSSVTECMSPSSSAATPVRATSRGRLGSRMSNLSAPPSQYETYAVMPSAVARTLWP